ncbi:DUF484 family protein [Methylomagnum sp.]
MTRKVVSKVPKVSKKRNPESGVTMAEVEAFLYQHPGFFEEHLDLLEILKIPHPCGEAVSLVSRQVALLRDRNDRLQEQINDIVHIARDNDTLHQRIHQLTLTLLSATGLEDALAGLEWALHQYFQTDFVAVRIADPNVSSPIANLCMAPGGGGSELFATALDSGQPHCGKPDPVQAEFLFGERAPEIASYALVPLQHAGLRGLLAIGSHDARRFQPGMGLLFLTQMGEILAARLAALVGGQG